MLTIQSEQNLSLLAARLITTSPPMAACNITIDFTAVNEIDISAAESAAHPYFDVYVSLPVYACCNFTHSPFDFHRYSVLEKASGMQDGWEYVLTLPFEKRRISFSMK